jgi:hypothetical protein
MILSDYESWFETLHNQLSLEEGAREHGPFLGPTIAPGVHHWKLDWAILFRDGMHVRLKETYWPNPFALGGGGRRRHFSYHYGTTPSSVDPRGFPTPRLSIPTIRLDNDKWGPHAHFQGEDHIKQARIQGLQLDSVEMFPFLGVILQHRETKIPIDDLWGFRLV